MGVIGFSMTSCDFWGASECVFDFEYVEFNERVIIPNLQKKWEDVKNASPAVSYDGYIEVLITFSSGDQLRVACEKIIVP